MKTSKANVRSRPGSRRSIARGALVAAGLVLGAGMIGCSDQKVAAASPSTASGAPSAAIPEVLATIGDEKVTLSDVRKRIGDDLDQNETRYRVQQGKLLDAAVRGIVRERVLDAEAMKQNKTVDQLLAAEVGGSLEPTDVEISTWYTENQDRMRGRTLAQVGPEIGNYLRRTRRDEAAEKLEARLNAERKVSINVEPYRLTFDNAKAPSFGPESAPVTLVEFSDFECPFCARFYPTLNRLKEAYGDKLHIVYRQFPLTSIHQNAFKAAEASLCAHEQGKFWQMHDLMFQEQQGLAVRDLKVKAGRVGVDQSKFDACLESGRYAEQVQNDLREGNRAGVTGTPAMFLNGVSLEGGAVTFETMKKLIDKELAARASK
jgi:protein-disulfide isomerase